MSAIVCKRGRSFLLQSISSSLLINRSYSSLLPDSATSIPPSSSVSSSLSLSDNLYNRRGQILRIPQLVNANGKRTFLVDTLALFRKLEAQGLPTKQAEAITCAINEVLNESFQDNSLLQRETEKLRGDIEKMHNEFAKIRSELKYEIDKVTAGQRLDLNLERGRSRDELAKQNSETTELNNKLDRVSDAMNSKLDRVSDAMNSKLDREIHALRAQLETAKLDLIKYGIGAVLSLSAVGLGIFRLFSH